MKDLLKELVIDNKKPFGVVFYDTYGNRTSNLTISNKQLLQIKNILNKK
jgi:hypothetical protein